MNRPARRYGPSPDHPDDEPQPPNRRRHARAAGRRRAPTHRRPVGPRIIAGCFRGRRLLYSGALATRPMKDRLRESVFGRLGRRVAGSHAIDLFAGTGALGFEALSRGAARATFIERHRPTAELVRRNAVALGVEAISRVIPGDVFRWIDRWLADLRQLAGQSEFGPEHWLIFCSPPYDFYVDRADAMLSLVARLLEAAPPGSLMVVESDERFDFALLPEADGWDVRHHRPAVVGIFEKAASGGAP